MSLRSFSVSLASLLFIVYLPAYTNAQETPRPYPADYVESFVKGCTANSGIQVEAICRCLIRTAQSKYTLEQFEEFKKQIEADRKIPPELLQIIEVCQSQV